MQTLRDQLEEIENRRKTLEVYTDQETTVSELAAQFSTRNVAVTQNAYSIGDDSEFVIIRNEDGEAQGAVGIEKFRQLIAPDINPPWTASESSAEFSELFDFLDSTLFTSFSRRQMLAASREIEERAWRADKGALYVGFQNSAAVNAQVPVYNRFARHSAVDIHVYIDDELQAQLDESIGVIADGNEEIGRFWFLLFDGDGADRSKCGLLAEEREPARFYGFWTYESETVDEIIDYLKKNYGPQ